MPIKSRIADPNTQNNSNTINAVVLLRRVNLKISLLLSPCVNVANIGSRPIGSIATNIITKFSTKRLSMFAVY
jgi:hypothetical protein